MLELMKVDQPDDSNLSYSIYDKDGVRLFGREDQVCFGGITGSSWRDRDDPAPKYLVTTIQKAPADEPVTNMWTEYLTQTSPFRSLFVKESVPHIMDTMNMVVDLDNPSNLIGGGIISTRLSYEQDHTRNHRKGLAWYKLVEKGMDPDLAYMVALRLTILDGLSVVGVTNSPNHTMINNSVDSDVVNYLLNKPRTNSPFSRNYYIHDTFSLWRTSTTGERFNNLLSEVFNSKENSEASVYVNPFAQVRNQNEKPLDKMVDQLSVELSGFNVNEFFGVKEAA
jgi:hypothetical protein